jgi:5'-nucleotidase
MTTRILLTNDDGIGAPGLEALEQALLRLGEVWVVAPHLEASATAHAVSLTRPVWVEQVGERRYTVTGTPTDCVFIGQGQLLPAAPDLVLSGINRGGNVAVDVTYSGTVGAAMEGSIRGIPSISVSRNSFEPGDYAPAADIAANIAEEVLRRGLPDGVFLNVNVPALPADRIRGVVPAPLGQRRYGGDIDVRHDPRGRPYSWIAGAVFREDEIPGTDNIALRDGFATVTPIAVDWTERETLAQLADWEFAR